MDDLPLSRSPLFGSHSFYGQRLSDKSLSQWPAAVFCHRQPDDYLRRFWGRWLRRGFPGAGADVALSVFFLGSASVTLMQRLPR